MYRLLFFLASLCLLVACDNKKNKAEQSELKEAGQAKALLQGIWIDDDSDSPLWRVEGDTIYYTDPEIAPVYFRILKDTLYLHGNELTGYHIDRQSEYAFWFHTQENNVIKLHKSENQNDTLYFRTKTVEVIPTYTEVTKRDSVVMYNGTRYRAYVYINPSKMKVVRTSYSDEGLNIDNVYYDNVMHICVYEGKNSLYNSDITKQMFAEVVPEEFLGQAILTDMNFMKVDKNGFHYQAMVRIPESSVYNVINLIIGFDWKLTITSGK